MSKRQSREKLYEEYRRLGMTEEQIKAIRAFDDEVEKSDENYYRHTVSMEDIRRKEQKAEEENERYGNND